MADLPTVPSHAASKLASIARIVVLALGVLVCLRPPWVYTFTPPGAATVYTPGPHALVWQPPPPSGESRIHGVQLDLSRLALELLAIGAVAVAAWTLMTRRQGK